MTGYTSTNIGGLLRELVITAPATNRNLVRFEVDFGNTQSLTLNKILEDLVPITLSELGYFDISLSVNRTSGSSPMTLGSQGKTDSDLTRRLVGAIGELLIYTKRLTESEIDYLEYYLDRWVS